jgi:hypothetical protein
MGRRFLGQVDAFPSYPSISISLFPDELEDEDALYEVEIAKDLKTLATFLNKLRAMSEPDHPCESFVNTARDMMQRHTGSFYTNQENIAQIIDQYRKDFTPKHEFPGGSEAPDIMDFFISESITLKEGATINGEYLPEGTQITFHHKGNLNG